MACGGGRSVVSKIPIAVWSCAPGFSDASSRSPLPFPLQCSSFSFFSRPLADSAALPLTPPLPAALLPPSPGPPIRLHSLRGLSPRFTRASANLFRRLGDGGRAGGRAGGWNRSTLYSSRIDRQPRTDMEALYFPSSHLRVALSETLLSIKRALPCRGLPLFLSLPAPLPLRFPPLAAGHVFRHAILAARLDL